MDGLKRATRDPLGRSLLQSSLYVWRGGVGSEHAGLRGAADAIKVIKDRFGHNVPTSTMYKWLAKEGLKIKEGQGLKKCPDVISDLAKYKKDLELDKEMRLAPPATRLPVHHWPALASRIKDAVQMAPGFGADLAIAISSQFFTEMYPDDIAPWIPSESWMYRFLGNYMHLVRRRITCYAQQVPPATLAAQQRMVDATEQHVGFRLQRDVTARRVASSDEFGARMVPNCTIVWEEKGSDHVVAPMPESKAQCTADYVNTADGRIPLLHQIFKGKTPRSLPSAKAQSLCARTLFNITENHWYVQTYVYWQFCFSSHRITP